MMGMTGNTGRHHEGSLARSTPSVQGKMKCWMEVNSSSTGQNGHLFADNIFRCIFVNEKFCILIKILLKFVPQDPVDNNPVLV